MFRCSTLLLLAFALLIQAPCAGLFAEEPATPVGRTVGDFRLRDAVGREYSLADYQDDTIVVIAFLGTECPLAKMYGPRLSELAAEYTSRGVAFLGVNSNTQDSNTEIAAYARRHELNFPLLKDLGNQLADELGARRTPEVFVLDQQRIVCYWGRIDDQYGVGYLREKPTRKDLQVALDELLAGKPVSQPMAESVGCLIGRVKAPDEASPITYSKQVSRIFQRHCVECHRPGEIAPFSLTKYEEVVGWADTIAEVIRDQRMPPWHANPEHGRFANARLMSEEEKQTVFEWVDHGAPEGDRKQLPATREYVAGWQLSREPDAIVAMRDRPFVIPSGGTVEYQYFVVDPGFKEDKWVRGAEVIPGNRSVVHHAIVFFRTPEETDRPGLGWLTAYVPGQSVFEFPSHQARLVPAGSKFIFQMHYTPTGSPQEDITKVGLIFADPQQVREELVTLLAINHEFEIPPFAEDFSVKAWRNKFPKGAKLHAIAPHMHVRGKSFRVEAIRQGSDKPRVLLDVPRYDFNWQHAYQLAEPLAMDQGVRLRCAALFDNSENNLVNPDPSATVRWGDQTWEEMMIAFFEVSIPVRAPQDRSQREPGTLSELEQARVQRNAEELIRRFDKDGDGIVRRNETPDAFATFAFGRFDQNRDNTITADEARRGAEAALRRKQNGRGR
jgi:peroxiredoxin/mono/diheme cytochrome c family protein